MFDLKNKKGIVLMIFSSIFACFGQLFWKLSSSLGLNILILGFILYGIGACFMMVAYRHGKLSVLQPMLSLNYVLSLILGYFVLHEAITSFRIFGIFAILIGVIFIGGDNN